MTSTAGAYAGEAAAHELLERAHDAAYRYPPNFAGFTARVEARHDALIATGRIRVAGPRDVVVEIDADETLRSWLERELGSLVGHRWGLPYHEADGRHTLRLDPDQSHPLGQLIKVEDDRFDSSYRVQDGHISQVNRRMGTNSFSILIQERIVTTDGQTLPNHFTVTHWDNERGRLVRAESYEDRFVTVDGVPLPQQRRVVVASDEGTVVHELALRDHRRLR